MIDHLAAEPTGFNYTDKPPRGVKLSLLTKGKVQVTGVWVDDGSFIAWAPLLRRNRAKERELGIL